MKNESMGRKHGLEQKAWPRTRNWLAPYGFRLCNRRSLHPAFTSCAQLMAVRSLPKNVHANDSRTAEEGCAQCRHAEAKLKGLTFGQARACGHAFCSSWLVSIPHSVRFNPRVGLTADFAFEGEYPALCNSDLE